MSPEQAKANFKPTRKYRANVPASVVVGSPNWFTLAKTELDNKFDTLGPKLQSTIDQYVEAGMIEGAVNKMPTEQVQINAPVQPATPLPATQAVQTVQAPVVNQNNVVTPSSASNQTQGYGESQY